MESKIYYALITPSEYEPIPLNGQTYLVDSSIVESIRSSKEKKLEKAYMSEDKELQKDSLLAQIVNNKKTLAAITKQIKEMPKRNFSIYWH